VAIKYKNKIKVSSKRLFKTDTMDYKKEVLEHTDNTITTDWSGGSYDMEVGTENTADGYTLYYIKESNAPLFIEEHVYYDEDNFIESLQEFIKGEVGTTILIWDEDILERIDWEEIYNELDIKG